MLIVKKALTRQPLLWVDLTLGSNVSFPEFRHAFLQKYWNSHTQYAIRAKINNGKFQPNNRESYADYFLKLARDSQMVTPPIPVEEFIPLIARHFDDQMRNNIIVAKPKTLAEALELLTALQNPTPDNTPTNVQSPQRQWSPYGVGAEAQGATMPRRQQSHQSARERYVAPNPRGPRRSPRRRSYHNDRRQQQNDGHNYNNRSQQYRNEHQQQQYHGGRDNHGQQRPHYYNYVQVQRRRSSHRSRHNSGEFAHNNGNQQWHRAQSDSPPRYERRRWSRDSRRPYPQWPTQTTPQQNQNDPIPTAPTTQENHQPVT